MHDVPTVYLSYADRLQETTDSRAFILYGLRSMLSFPLRERAGFSRSALSLAVMWGDLFTSSRLT